MGDLIIPDRESGKPALCRRGDYRQEIFTDQKVRRN
jgi:hypothetical protein